MFQKDHTSIDIFFFFHQDDLKWFEDLRDKQMKSMNDGKSKKNKIAKFRNRIVKKPK